MYLNENPWCVLPISSEKNFIIGKQLDKKPKVNFNIYDVTNRNTKNYNKHIAKYLSN